MFSDHIECIIFTAFPRVSQAPVLPLTSFRVKTSHQPWHTLDTEGFCMEETGPPWKAWWREAVLVSLLHSNVFTTREAPPALCTQLCVPRPKHTATSWLSSTCNPHMRHWCPDTHCHSLSEGRMINDALLVLFKICFPLKINVTCASSHLKYICFHINGNICVILSSLCPLPLPLHSSPPASPSPLIPYLSLDISF